MNPIYILSHCFDKSKGVLRDMQLQLIYSSRNSGVCFLKTCVFYRYLKNLRSNPNQWPWKVVFKMPEVISSIGAQSTEFLIEVSIFFCCERDHLISVYSTFFWHTQSNWEINFNIMDSNLSGSCCTVNGKQ